MVRARFASFTGLLLLLAGLPALGQQPPAPPIPAAAPAPEPPPPASAVAVTVNGQPIPEIAVYRAMRGADPSKKEQARVEIINFLVDNVLIDQYLKQQKVTAEPADVDARVSDMRKQLIQQKLDFGKVLQDMYLTEAELREHISEELRWDKYITTQATEATLRDVFTKGPDLFDGSLVHARHILLTPPANDAKATADAKAKLLAVRTQLETAVTQELAKLPPNADNLTKQTKRREVLDEKFGAAAKQYSACPSKDRGGDVDWFPRAGTMVEPFAKAAFALKPYELSDVVVTPFGLHLILCVERKAGKETKFEDVKDMVKDVYASRLRDALLAQLRPAAKIAK